MGTYRDALVSDEWDCSMWLLRAGVAVRNLHSCLGMLGAQRQAVSGRKRAGLSDLPGLVLQGSEEMMILGGPGAPCQPQKRVSLRSWGPGKEAQPGE